MDSHNVRLVSNILKRISVNKGIKLKKHPSQDRWLVTIAVNSPEFESFNIEIYLEKDWISFNSPLMRNVIGNGTAVFYETVALLSSYLNGLKISLDPENDFIALKSEIDLSGLNNSQKEEAIQKMLKASYSFFVEYYSDIIKVAKKLNLSYKTGQVEKSQASWFVKEMLDSTSASIQKPAQPFIFQKEEDERKRKLFPRSNEAGSI